MTETANRFKALLGLPFEGPEKTFDLKMQGPKLGFSARARIEVSPNREWVTIYLPNNMGRICNHVNAYKHIFGIPYEKKAPSSAKTP
ncbi:MAG: hypothetical protein ABIQ95_12850 [Bdellovibrionia bacterium]